MAHFLAIFTPLHLSLTFFDQSFPLRLLLEREWPKFCNSSCVMYQVIVKNDPTLKMTPKTGAERFVTRRKLDCLTQHPKKPRIKMTHPDGEKSQ